MFHKSVCLVGPVHPMLPLVRFLRITESPSASIFGVPIKFPLFLTFTDISEFRIWTIAYLPSTENASKTFPGIPPQIAYPEFTKSIPSAIAGPAPSSEPPLASTPLTVL